MEKIDFRRENISVLSKDPDWSESYLDSDDIVDNDRLKCVGKRRDIVKK